MQELGHHVNESILCTHDRYTVRCLVTGQDSASAVGQVSFVRSEGRKELRIIGAKALLEDAGLQLGDLVSMEISATMQLKVSDDKADLA